MKIRNSMKFHKKRISDWFFYIWFRKLFRPIKIRVDFDDLKLIKNIFFFFFWIQMKNKRKRTDLKFDCTEVLLFDERRSTFRLRLLHRRWEDFEQQKFSFVEHFLCFHLEFSPDVVEKRRLKTNRTSWKRKSSILFFVTWRNCSFFELFCSSWTHRSWSRTRFWSLTF